MRIACPFCGPRENGEFSYLGDAKPKRPGSGCRRRGRLRLRLSARQRRRRDGGTLVSRRRLPLLAEGPPQYGDARDIFGRGGRRCRCGEGGVVSAAGQTHRLASGGLIDRRQAARFHLRRSGDDGLRRRHAGFGADRQRREAGRPLVQISPPARHPHRRFGRAERAGRVAQRRETRAEHARHHD